jgi:hypothetical protein
MANDSTSHFRDGERKVIPSTTTSAGTSTPADYVKDTPVPAPDNEHLPATFVYAGIDVERRLFTGVRGKQIAGRCVLVNTGPFPCDAEWKGLVVTLEDALRRHHHEPGTLTRQARYLHRRTGGMIGSRSHLVRAAAQLAILEGDEAITRKLMDTMPVDHAAESSRSGAA